MRSYTIEGFHTPNVDLLFKGKKPYQGCTLYSYDVTKLKESDCRKRIEYPSTKCQ